MALKMEKLNYAVSMLNHKLGMALEMYTDNKINSGHFYIEQAYGGFKLVRISNGDYGSVSDISSRGSKREVYDFIKGILLGMELAK